MRTIFLYLLLATYFTSSAQSNLVTVLKKYNKESIPYIKVDQLDKAQNIYLDAREANEFKISHLPNAIYVGYNYFKNKQILTQVPDKNASIVVYCSIGVRSEQIAEKIKKLGYKNVYNLYGGIFEYKNSGFIKRAMQAQEIDAFYTTAGLVNHETGKQKCLYGTLTEQYAGITALKDVLKTPNVYTSGAGFFITNKNLKGDLKDALEKDIVSIINTSEYQTALKSGGAFIPGKNKKEQMKYVEDTAKAFTK